MPTLQECAIPFGVCLISFLAYPSQILFHRIEPYPLTTSQSVRFNVLVAAIFVSFLRASWTDPGRVPVDWVPSSGYNEATDVVEDDAWRQRQRWCRKCEAFKPPRAHHCKTCQRCIPKMDHHCVWLANCVSHTTLPHFLRFLLYSVITMSYLAYYLGCRTLILWHNRHLPSYLGPSMSQLALLFVLNIMNSITLFAIFVLCVRTIWCLGANTTTIEGWEIERHETLVRRARYLGGYLEGPDGVRVRITKQEYPWDIGIYANIAQGMGSKNPLAWFWPLAATPSIASGLHFPDNGLEEPGTLWPPPDPDRTFRVRRTFDPADAFTHSLDPEDFRRRQEADRLRLQDVRGDSTAYRRQPFHLRFKPDGTRKEDTTRYQSYQGGNDDDNAIYSDASSEAESDKRLKHSTDEGEEGWRNSEGERLGDFGVDEDVEFYDEDDLPLAELMRRRKHDHT